MWCRRPRATSPPYLSVLLAARGRDRLTRLARLCVRSGFHPPRSPWPAPFPPPPPRPPGRRCCSAASLVLRGRLIPGDRSSRDYGLGLPLAARPCVRRAIVGLPGSRAWRSAYMPGVFDRAGSSCGSRVGVAGGVAFRSFRQRSAPGIARFAAQWPACTPPVNASLAPSRTPAYDSGPSWFANPSMWDTFLPFSMPVYPGAPKVERRPGPRRYARPAGPAEATGAPGSGPPSDSATATGRSASSPTGRSPRSIGAWSRDGRRCGS